MRKRRLTAVLLSICVINIMLAFGPYIGAGINDRYKQELAKRYFGAETRFDLDVLETASFCGRDEDSGDFIIWAGMAVRSDLPYEQFERQMERIYEDSIDVDCVPYNMEFANTHGFTAIQKEVSGSDTADGYYIAGCRFSPKTIFDKRNPGLPR